MGIFDIFKSKTSETEESIGVNLLTREQKIGFLGITCYLCAPIFISEDKANEYCMILLAFTQLLGLNEKILLDVGKKLDAPDIEHYVANIKTIKKEKALILFNATCQQLIELSDNPHFMSIAYKRILMDIGYSSEESDAILDKSYFSNRDIEALKPNHDYSSISDLDIIVDYFGKQKNKAENELKKLYTPISEQDEVSINNSELKSYKKESALKEITFSEDNKQLGHLLDNTTYWDEEVEDWVDRPFIYNWKFSEFLKEKTNIQIKDVVNNKTGELYHVLIFIDDWDMPQYLKFNKDWSLSEIIEQKDNLLVGVTIYGNFWLHDGCKISARDAIY